jgi:hypothetical protein
MSSGNAGLFKDGSRTGKFSHFVPSSTCVFSVITSTRPISNYPTSFRKNEEILKVYGNFHLFKMALSIIRLFTREWHVL